MLVNSIDAIVRNIPANKSLTFERIKTFIEEAEETLVQSIGQEMYDVLDLYYNTVPSPTPNSKYDAAILLMQNAVSFLAFHFGYDILNTTISNTGFHRTEAENKTTVSLFQRQEENLKATFKYRGYNRLDKVLAYMEANKADFDEWTASSTYTAMLRNFINTTADFQLIYNIYDSRLLFQKIRNFQTLTEDLDILPLIGQAFFDELKAQILADSLTPENASFVAILKKAVAYRSIYRGGAEFIAVITDMGFYKIQNASNITNHTTKELATEKELSRIIDTAENIGISYLSACKNFLKANLADYPLYANSTAYDAGGVIKGTDKIVVI